jgi:serine/threonine-protein kinase
MGDAPTQVGSYRILSKLGEGGMGTVYEAVADTSEKPETPELNHPHVAIKLLHPEHARSEEFLARFFNEARAVSTINHHGLVQVSDSGKLPDGTAYIVMELLVGDSLAARLKRSGGALPVADVLRLGALIADSLAAAHEKGIVHRDLKPENIMIVADASVPGGERTKLLDFGIAKLSDAQDFVKTRTNAMLGTPLYMSPEQCRGAGKVDDRADVYSFGVLLFAMVAGRPPFSGEGMGDVMGKHMYEAPPLLEDCAPSVPAPLADLIAALLAKDKQQRPAMQKVHVELMAMAKELPHLMPKPRRADAPATGGGQAATGAPTAGTLAGQTQKTELTGRRAVVRFASYALGSALALLVPAALLLPRVLLRKPAAPAAVTVPEAPIPASPQPIEAPRKVRWKLDSQPAGASVARVSDGVELCQTPCTQELPLNTGLVKLRLLREGYQERIFELAQDKDAERNETLQPLRRASKSKRSAAPAAQPVAVAAPEPPAAAPPPPPPSKPVVHARPKIED